MSKDLDLFICFDKTSYPAKFFYRKAQMWVGAQISKVNVFEHIIYNGTTNRMVLHRKTKMGYYSKARRTCSWNLKLQEENGKYRWL